MPSGEVGILLSAVPEFSAVFAELVESADGDPGSAAAFAEFADYVSGLLARPERDASLLLRCAGSLEEVARCSPDAEELVGWSFMDGLSPIDLELLVPWLGPRALAIAQSLAAPELPGPPDDRTVR